MWADGFGNQTEKDNQNQEEDEEGFDDFQGGWAQSVGWGQTENQEKKEEEESNWQNQNAWGTQIQSVTDDIKENIEIKEVKEIVQNIQNVVEETKIVEEQQVIWNNDQQEEQEEETCGGFNDHNVESQQVKEEETKKESFHEIDQELGKIQELVKDQFGQWNDQQEKDNEIEGEEETWGGFHNNQYQQQQQDESKELKEEIKLEEPIIQEIKVEESQQKKQEFEVQWNESPEKQSNEDETWGTFNENQLYSEPIKEEVTQILPEIAVQAQKLNEQEQINDEQQEEIKEKFSDQEENDKKDSDIQSEEKLKEISSPEYIDEHQIIQSKPHSDEEWTEIDHSSQKNQIVKQTSPNEEQQHPYEDQNQFELKEDHIRSVDKNDSEHKKSKQKEINELINQVQEEQSEQILQNQEQIKDEEIKQNAWAFNDEQEDKKSDEIKDQAQWGFAEENADEVKEENNQLKIEDQQESQSDKNQSQNQWTYNDDLKDSSPEKDDDKQWYVSEPETNQFQQDQPVLASEEIEIKQIDETNEDNKVKMEEDEMKWGFNEEQTQQQEIQDLEKEVKPVWGFGQDNNEEDGFDEFNEAPQWNANLNLIVNKDEEPKIEDVEKKESPDKKINEEDFDENEENKEENQSEKGKEENIDEDDDGFDDFEGANESQAEIQQQQEEKREQVQEQDDEFDDFKEADESISQHKSPDKSFQESPQRLSLVSQSSETLTQIQQKDPNKINQLFDIYPNSKSLKEHMIQKLQIPTLEKEISIQDQIQKYEREIKTFQQIEIKSIEEMNQNFNHRLLGSQDKQKGTQVMRQFDDFKDSKGKVHQLQEIVNFDLNLTYDASNNDSTYKFTLSKKKKQEELLFSLNFAADLSTEWAQLAVDAHFGGQSQSQPWIQWEDSYYRQHVVDRFNVQIKKKDQSNDDKLKRENTLNLDSPRLNKQSSSIREQQFSNKVKQMLEENFEENEAELDDLGNKNEEEPNSNQLKQGPEENQSPPPTNSSYQIQQQDFVKDTFAKFGLNMNLYNPNSNLLSTGHDEKDSIREESQASRKKANQKIQNILQIIPDYGFLLDTKLALPQTFFTE